jgi:hypothetical protein
MDWGDIVFGTTTSLKLPTKSVTKPVAKLPQPPQPPSPPKIPTPSFMRAATPPASPPASLPASPPASLPPALPSLPPALPSLTLTPETPAPQIIIPTTPTTPPEPYEKEKAIIYTILQDIHAVHAERKVCVDDVIDELIKHQDSLVSLDRDYINSEISYYLHMNGILSLSEMREESAPVEEVKEVKEEETLVERLLYNRNKYASEATRTPYKQLKYTKSVYEKFHKRSFTKWCELDSVYNYIAQSEYFTPTNYVGKWVIYENGKSLKVCATCIEANAWIEQHKKKQTFPFPCWVFLMRVKEAYSIEEVNVEKGRFEQELIREMAEASVVRVAEPVQKPAKSRRKRKNRMIVSDIINGLRNPETNPPEIAEVKEEVVAVAEPPEVEEALEEVVSEIVEVAEVAEEVVSEAPDVVSEVADMKELTAKLQHLLQKIEDLEHLNRQPKQQTLLDLLREFFAQLCTLRKGA